MFKKVIFTICSVSIVSCSGSSDSSSTVPTVALGNESFLITSDVSLAADSDEIAGTGSIVAATPLGGIDSGNHFFLQGNLNPGSSITLVANGSNTNQGGTEISFSNVSGSLTVALAVGDASADISSSFAGRSATSVSYHIDVHNDETPAHILIWAGDQTTFPEDTALFNSESDGASPGNGAGTYWGVTLVDATVSSLTQGDAEFEEE